MKLLARRRRRASRARMGSPRAAARRAGARARRSRRDASAGAAARLPRCAARIVPRGRRAARSEAKEGALPPVVTLDQGVRYRADARRQRGRRRGPRAGRRRAGARSPVFTTNGDYSRSLGRGIEPTNNDRGEALRITRGKHDVPVAIEMAMAGCSAGAVRRVEMPSQMGFDIRRGQRGALSFSGRQRIERYQRPSCPAAAALPAGRRAALQVELLGRTAAGEQGRGPLERTEEDVEARPPAARGRVVYGHVSSGRGGGGHRRSLATTASGAARARWRRGHRAPRREENAVEAIGTRARRPGASRP